VNSDKNQPVVVVVEGENILLRERDALENRSCGMVAVEDASNDDPRFLPLRDGSYDAHEFLLLHLVALRC